MTFSRRELEPKRSTSLEGGSESSDGMPTKTRSAEDLAQLLPSDRYGTYLSAAATSRAFRFDAGPGDDTDEGAVHGASTSAIATSRPGEIENLRSIVSTLAISEVRYGLAAMQSALCNGFFSGRMESLIDCFTICRACPTAT